MYVCYTNMGKKKSYTDCLEGYTQPKCWNKPCINTALTVASPEKPNLIWFKVLFCVCVHKWSTRLNSPISSHTLTNRACLSADRHSRRRCTFCLLYLLLAALTLSPAIPLPPPRSSLLPCLKRHLSPRAISVICACLCVLCTSGGVWRGNFMCFPQNPAQQHPEWNPPTLRAIEMRVFKCDRAKLLVQNIEC